MTLKWRRKKRQAALEQQKHEAAEAAQRAIETAAKQHADYVARYVNPGSTRTPGEIALAVVAASEDKAINTAVMSALASQFGKQHAEIVPSLFKPAFVADGLFQQAFDGSGDPFRKLDLTNSVDAVVLARETVTYAENAALDNLVSATMQLKVEVVPIVGTLNSGGWTFTARGPGFSKDVARQAAEESLIHQITTDTNMSLGSHTSNP